MTENYPHVLRHHALKRVGFPPNPYFEPKDFFFLLKKKGDTHAFDKHKIFAKKIFFLMNMFPIQGKW